MESPDYATAADLKLIRDRVDRLQMAETEEQKPWYKQRPSLASLLALGVSIITFIISQHSSSLQETRSKQDDLRKLLTDVIALQIEQKDTVSRISEQGERIQYMQAMNNKRILWLESAESLVDQLGTNVTASEYETLANQRWLDSEFEKSKSYDMKALGAAKDRFAKNTALRALGSFFFITPPMRDLKQGTDYFQKSVDVLGTPADDYSNFLLGFTYETWAYGDQFNNLRNERAEHVKKAREYYSAITPTNYLHDSSLSGLATAYPDVTP